MRTAAICPTCATYFNAVCVLYDGPDNLTCIPASPNDNLDEILVALNDTLCDIKSDITTINNTLGALPDPVGTVTSVQLSGGAGISISGTNPVTTTGTITVSSTAWLKGGNAGTNDTVDFIGTTDNKDLVFKANSTEYLRIESSNGDIITPTAFRATGTGTSVQATSSLGTESIVIGQNTTDKGYISITAGAGNTALIRGVNLTGIRAHELPDDDGTYALSVNGIPAGTDGNVNLGGYTGTVNTGTQTLTFTNGVLTSVTP